MNGTVLVGVSPHVTTLGHATAAPAAASRPTGAALTVKGVTIRSNTARIGANVYNQPAGGDFRIDGKAVPAGPNSL